MYIDLIRAYLQDYGTHRQLARALNITEAYLSFLLEPPRTVGARRYGSYWLDTANAPLHQLVEAQKFLKTPSQQRAVQIAENLCDERDRRERLLHHVDLSRRRTGPPDVATGRLSRDEVGEVNRRLGMIHGVALTGLEPDAVSQAYQHVWELAADTVGRIGTEGFPAEHAQVLMFLHDAASVLDRNDLALAFARRAALVLSRPDASRVAPEVLTRLHINCLLAEVVSLNNLGLANDVLRLMVRAMKGPARTVEPGIWLRSFLEQELTALSTLPRLSIYRAEATADRAMALTPDDEMHRARLAGKLLDAYVSHGSARSVRRARHLAAELDGVAARTDLLNPLRLVVLHRTLARYFQSIGDTGARTWFLDRARTIAMNAGLSHQLAQMSGQRR